MTLSARRVSGDVKISEHVIESLTLALGGGIMTFACYLAITSSKWQQMMMLPFVLWSGVTYLLPLVSSRTPWSHRPPSDRIAVIITVDTAANMVQLRELFQSVSRQRHQPSAVYLVSYNCPEAIQHNIAALFSEWAETEHLPGIYHCASVRDVMTNERDATLFALIDAGKITALDKEALYEASTPFKSPAVQMVRGLHVGKDLVSTAQRAEEIGLLALQASEYETLSYLGSVPVNDTGFVLCRGWIIAQAALRASAPMIITSAHLGEIQARSEYGMRIQVPTAIALTSSVSSLREETTNDRWWQSLWKSARWLTNTHPPFTWAWWYAVCQLIALALLVPVLLAYTGAELVSGHVSWEGAVLFLPLWYFRTTQTVFLQVPGGSLSGRMVDLLALLPLAVLLDAFHALRIPGRTVRLPAARIRQSVSSLSRD